MSEGSLQYAEEFAQLAEKLLTERHEEPTMDHIVTAAVDTIEPCDYCGITVRESDGKLGTAAATGMIAEKAAAIQYELGEGPCLDVATSLGTLSAPDVANDSRWPHWAPAAADLGIGSMLSLSLVAADQPWTASLNLFAGQPHAFDPTDLAIASVFARHATTALAVVRNEGDLRAAAKSRQLVGVAEGMLMQRFGLTLDQSFELLRRYSQNHNIKLRTLAERLAASGGIQSDQETPGQSLDEAFGLIKD